MHRVSKMSLEDTNACAQCCNSSSAATRKLHSQPINTAPNPQTNGTHLPSAAREKWKQMRFLPRYSSRTQRKLYNILAAAILLTIIYNQFTSYAIISKASESRIKTTAIQKLFASCGDAQEEIDVVYTWVNGSEERFQADINRIAGANFTRPDAYAPQRFSDKQELKYSLRSLEKHMPWVRHVYIVTNGQIPSWLNLDYARVSIVTHAEIFQDGNDLPTFSSPAIEANLHRIPGLSQKFIYFNDDLFLNADIYPEDFHTRNRGYKIYTAWSTNCATKCEWENIGNQKCEPACNNEDCDFDGGDCDDFVPNNEKITESETNYTNLPFLEFSNSSNMNSNDLSLHEQIKKYNEDKIKSQKRFKDFQRNRQNFHIETMNNFAIKLFPGVSDLIQPIDFGQNRKQAKKDLYSSSLIFTQKLLGRMFGYAMRNVIAHAPIMIDRRIMAEVQEEFPKEFKNTIRHRFRHEDNLQIAFIYSYFMSLVKREKSIGEIFDEYDTDNSGTWSDREIHTLLTRVYKLPLKIEMVVEFQNLLNNCTHSLSPEELQQETARFSPEYERYVDSTLTLVTKKMILECASLKAVLKNHPTITHEIKHQHEFVEAAEHVSFNQLHSAAAKVMDTLNNVRRTPRKFVCINDDLVRTNATRADNELVLNLLEDFFLSLFPTPSKFELAPEFRNRFARMDDLRAWQDLGGDFSYWLYIRLMLVVVLIVCVIVVCRMFRFRVRRSYYV